MTKLANDIVDGMNCIIRDNEMDEKSLNLVDVCQTQIVNSLARAIA